MNLELFPIPFSAPLFTPTLHYVQAIILDRWKVCLKIVFAVDNITCVTIAFLGFSRTKLSGQRSCLMMFVHLSYYNDLLVVKVQF